MEPKKFIIRWLLMVVAGIAATILCNYFIGIAESIPNGERVFLGVANLIWNGGLTIFIIVMGIRYFIWRQKLKKK